MEHFLPDVLASAISSFFTSFFFFEVAFHQLHQLPYPQPTFSDFISGILQLLFTNFKPHPIFIQADTRQSLQNAEMAHPQPFGAGDMAYTMPLENGIGGPERVQIHLADVSKPEAPQSKKRGRDESSDKGSEDADIPKPKRQQLADATSGCRPSTFVPDVFLRDLSEADASATFPPHQTQNPAFHSTPTPIINDPVPQSKKVTRMSLSDFPRASETPPANLTLVQICQQYPNHLQNRALIPFVQARWTSRKILRYAPEALKSASVNPINCMQKRLTKTRKGLEDRNELNALFEAPRIRQDGIDTNNEVAQHQGSVVATRPQKLRSRKIHRHSEQTAPSSVAQSQVPNQPQLALSSYEGEHTSLSFLDDEDAFLRTEPQDNDAWLNEHALPEEASTEHCEPISPNTDNVEHRNQEAIAEELAVNSLGKADHISKSDHEVPVADNPAAPSTQTEGRVSPQLDFSDFDENFDLGFDFDQQLLPAPIEWNVDNARSKGDALAELRDIPALLFENGLNDSILGQPQDARNETRFVPACAIQAPQSTQGSSEDNRTAASQVSTPETSATSVHSLENELYNSSNSSKDGTGVKSPGSATIGDGQAELLGIGGALEDPSIEDDAFSVEGYLNFIVADDWEF